MTSREGLIQFSSVWKKFQRGELHDSLRDLIPALTKRAVGRGGDRDRLTESDFWALKDVSFEVKPGEALGIIGPNGAGKSTVLKVLTKILRPNRGYSFVKGRIGALIEVAAGFHPDLTGRENIFLQAAVMGMPRRETKQRFEEIVEFSGISDFIDTQVKRYSSGMNARLGFAIAAHLNPDVLIVDEVLAVGDQKFQEKAFGRMREIAKSGIPVLVVSHQLERVAELCTRALLLDQGEVRMKGDPAACIAEYVGAVSRVSGGEEDESVVLRGLDVEDTPVSSGGRLRFEVDGTVGRCPDPSRYGVGFRFRALHTGEIVFAGGTDRLGISLPGSGPFRIRGSLQANVPPGVYSLEATVWDVPRGENLGGGLSAPVNVSGGDSFWGKIQLNLDLELDALDREAQVLD